jgi:mono/diheme cytochrome c family protein
MRKLILIPLLALPLFARPARAADAETNWSKKCASCHGKDGAADTTMGKKHKIKSMLTDEWRAKFDAKKIKEVITNGVKDTKMQAFKDKLTPQEIDDLTNYVLALKK